MSPLCIVGREVVLQLRDRKTKRARTANVVCPAYWSKSRLLTYARREHSDETVVIAEWMETMTGERPWKTRLWIVNPQEMREELGGHR